MFVNKIFGQYFMYDRYVIFNMITIFLSLLNIYFKIYRTQQTIHIKNTM